MGDDDLHQDEFKQVSDENDLHDQVPNASDGQEVEHKVDEVNGATDPEPGLPKSPAPDPLDQMPLELTLRCGKLVLSLGELRHLASGVVLEVCGITPGHATLCHGERVVAEGELVEVDGRLGLQITRTAY